MASARCRRTTILVLAGGLGMGGSERQLLLLLSELSRKGAFDLHVLAFNHDASFVLNQSLEDLGVRVWMVPVSCTGKLERLWFLQRLVLEIKPDVIHSWAFHTNAYAAIVGVTAGVKGRIGSLRSLFSLAEEGLGKPMAFVSLFLVPQLVVNSKSIQQEVVAAGYPAARVMLLENCVPVPDEGAAGNDLREFPELGIGKDHIVIGAVGNLRPVKQHHILVRAVAQLVERFPRLRAVIVGSPVVPSVRDSLLEEIKQRGLEERVVLAGFRADVSALMRRFDVFCITSRSEGSPNVVIEAMAAGRPIVATSVGGIPELIQDGVNGVLVPPGDTDRVAQAIAEFLKNPEHAALVGAAGRRTVESRACPGAAERLAALYAASVPA